MHRSTDALLPDLDQLVAFETVARTLGFSAAARLLALDASVVARRIGALERRLGTRLFARTTRRMALTEAGTAYLARVQPALDELATAAAEARDRRALPAGLLRVALPLGFGRRWVAPLLPDFLETHPDVVLDMRFADRYVDLVDDRFDLALRLGALDDSGLVARRVRDCVRGVYASPGYLTSHGLPRTPLALASHRGLGFAGFERPARWTLSNGRAQHVVDVPLRLVADDAASLVALACADIGVIVGTDWLVHDAVVAGRLVRLLPRWTVGEPGAVHVMLPTTRFVPAKTRAFADWVVAAIRALPPWCGTSAARPRSTAVRRRAGQTG